MGQELRWGSGVGPESRRSKIKCAFGATTNSDPGFRWSCFLVVSCLESRTEKTRDGHCFYTSMQRICLAQTDFGNHVPLCSSPLPP